MFLRGTGLGEERGKEDEDPRRTEPLFGPFTLFWNVKTEVFEKLWNARL